MDRSNLAALTVFAEVAATRSFRAAARSLGLSPSAVSHSITKLERQLGIRLLARSTRSVSPTVEGQQLLERVRPAFTLIDDAVAELDHAHGVPAGQIRITLPRIAAHILIGPRIGDFARAFPHVILELSVDDSLVDIVATQFDAGIRLGESLANGMIAVRAGGQQRLVAVATPDLLAVRGTPKHPHDLIAYPCLRSRMPDRSLHIWEFERDGEEINVSVQGTIIVNDDILLMQAVRSGAGIGFVFQDLALAEIKDGRLVRLLDEWTPAFPGFYIYYSSRRHIRPALRAFLDYFGGPTNSLARRLRI
jgi:DNA-binding transcriptional LysR family regulator